MIWARDFRADMLSEVEDEDFSKKYRRVRYAFDIETTRKNKKAFMYIWQISINGLVILGRTWDEYKRVAKEIEKFYCDGRKIICWVHNFSHEWQFLKKRMDWGINKKTEFAEVFAMEERKVIRATTYGGTEYRCSAVLSGGSLEQLAKDFTKTQKLKGDLDYSIERNSKSELDSQELQYCINDVVILDEYADYLFKTFGDKIPMTKTGIVRAKIKECFQKLSEADQKEISKRIKRCFPTEEQYETWFKWLFCGGYVHADWLHVGEVIESDDMVSVDFKSSYPSVMFEKMPWELKATQATIGNLNFLEKNIEDFAMILHVRLHNLKRKTSHAIISKHKAVFEDGIDPITDNGRVVSVNGWTTLILTEYDWDIIKKFYSFDELRDEDILGMKWGKKEYLPRYVTDVLYELYTLKNSLPKNTPEYALAKASLNAVYGCTVQKLCLDSFGYDFNKVTLTGAEKSYFGLIQGKLLLPQWGIWITSRARYNLLTTCYDVTMNSDFGSDAIYMDTDSIKLLNYSKHKEIIDEYNDKIMARNIKIKEERGYDIGKLGIFDLEHFLIKFKTLGCKRYINDFMEDDERVTEVTLAGLPKKALIDYCKKNGLDPYEQFTESLCLDEEESEKNTSYYSDEPYEDWVDGELMQEESGVAITPISFNMNRAHDFLALVMSERNKKFIGERTSL